MIDEREFEDLVERAVRCAVRIARLQRDLRLRQYSPLREEAESLVAELEEWLPLMPWDDFYCDVRAAVTMAGDYLNDLNDLNSHCPMPYVRRVERELQLRGKAVGT